MRRVSSSDGLEQRPARRERRARVGRQRRRSPESSAESNRNSSASSGSAARSATASHGGVSDGDGSARGLHGHPASGADGQALVRALHGEERHRVAEVVRVRRHHGGRRLDLQVVVQAAADAAGHEGSGARGDATPPPARCSRTRWCARPRTAPARRSADTQLRVAEVEVGDRVRQRPQVVLDRAEQRRHLARALVPGRDGPCADPPAAASPRA